jgi:hypothetical protein
VAQLVPPDPASVPDPDGAPSADIIPFPVPFRAPKPAAEGLRRAAAHLAEAAERLRRESDACGDWRAGFELAKARLTTESDRARAIASDGARIAAAIERGDLDALQALHEEIAARVKAGTWP